SFSAVVALVLSLTWTATTQAGTPAPLKASYVIELNSAFGSGRGQCPFGGLAADSLNNPDATRTAGFTVPVGHVLVLTNVDFEAFAASSSVLVSFIVSRETAGSINFINSDLDSVSGTDSLASAHLSLNGAVVKPGVTLCIECFDHSTHGLITSAADCSGTIHGFLARDS